MKLFPFLAILLFSFQPVAAQTVIYTETFETDGEGSRYTSNTFSDCTNSDYFIRTNTNPVSPPSCAATFGTTLTNLQGTFFWACEDIRTSGPVPGSRPPGSITTQAINISHFNSLTVSLFLATSNNNNARWEASDSLNIQASFNGVDYFTVGRFMGKGTPVVGARLGIDGNLNGVYEAGIDPATDCDVANFTQYSFSIPGTGSNLYIRLDFDQIGGTEELAIDQVRVSGVSTLPVKLVSFNAVKNNNSEVELNWQVADGMEVSSFDVERSVNGQQFLLLQRIQAHSGTNYSFTDPAASSVSFYRLRMTDRDGQFTYSQVLKVTGASAQDDLTVFPNPAITNIQVIQHAGRRISGSYIVYEAAGKPVLQWSATLQEGTNTFTFPVGSLPGGQYILVWKEDGVKKLSRLFIKQ